MFKRKKQIMNAAEKLDTVHISLYHKAKSSIFIVYIYAMIEISKDNSYSNCPYTELTQQKYIHSDYRLQTVDINKSPFL